MNKSASDFNSQHFEVAGFIREVFGYMERFKGQLFILKIDDSLMDHPLFPVLMRDIALLHKAGIRIIIVPGTRKSIDAQLKDEFEVFLAVEFLFGIAAVVARSAVFLLVFLTEIVEQQSVSANG